jgi:hypothetical protein
LSTIKTNNQHSTRKKTEKVTKWVYLDEYIDFFHGKRKAISEKGLDALGQELLEYAQDEDSLVLGDFFFDKGIPETSYRQWLAKNELFNLRYQAAKKKIGSRRERGALEREFAEKTALTSMAIYDSEWKEIEKWRSSLRSKEQAAGKADFQVVMEKFPSTDIVKERNEKKEGEASSSKEGS